MRPELRVASFVPRKSTGVAVMLQAVPYTGVMRSRGREALGARRRAAGSKGPGSYRTLLAVLLLGACVLELASETLHMTTYYPSPLGIYRKIVTTMETVLNKNGGNAILVPNASNPGGSVGIGTSAPDPGVKLDVEGDVNVGGQIRIAGGAPGPGKVLTSDAGGNATWQTPGGGDILVLNGSNPACPPGYESISRRWLSRTCMGSCSGPGGCLGTPVPICTSGSGWGDLTPHLSVGPDAWNDAQAGTPYCEGTHSPGGCPCLTWVPVHCHANSWDKILCVQ